MEYDHEHNEKTLYGQGSSGNSFDSSTQPEVETEYTSLSRPINVSRHRCNVVVLL